MNGLTIFIIIAVIAIVLLIVFRKLFKVPKIGCIGMVTGGVKCGKSMLSVWLAVRKYRSQRRKWQIRTFFLKAVNKLFRKEFPLPEEPLLYSNVKLAGVKYTLITQDMLLRNVRLAYGSVAYIQEASLVADGMSFKQGDEFNERLLLFNKLFGHETKGGYLIYDTQCIADNHYAVRRCLNSYFWIHHLKKIPFFCLLYVREMFFSEDNSAMNMIGDDVETGLKVIVIPKRVWKMYDAYCYSALTDGLERVQDDLYTPRPKGFQKADLKMRKIVSFKKFKTIREYNDDKEDKKNGRFNKKKVNL